MAEVSLEFLGHQVALVLEGLREVKGEVAEIKAELADVKARMADRELIARALRSFEGHIDSFDMKHELGRTNLATRVSALEARLDALEDKVNA